MTMSTLCRAPLTADRTGATPPCGSVMSVSGSCVLFGAGSADVAAGAIEMATLPVNTPTAMTTATAVGEQRSIVATIGHLVDRAANTRAASGQRASREKVGVRATRRPALCEAAAAANGSGTLLCGERRWCGAAVVLHHHLGVTAFAEYVVISARSAIKIDRELPFESCDPRRKEPVRSSPGLHRFVQVCGVFQCFAQHADLGMGWS